MSDRGRGNALSGLQRSLRRPWYAAWKGLERAFYEGHEYSIQPPWGHRVYTPWFSPDADPDFARAYHAARRGGPMGVTPDRCYLLHKLCRRALDLPGSVAECGVFQGGTAQLLSATMAARRTEPPPLHLFDTFQGMPSSTKPSRDYHAPGDFGETSLEFVSRRLAAYPFVRLHAGLVPETFVELEADERFSLAHIDLDIYESTRGALDGIWERVVPGGSVVFDDYGFYPYRSAAKVAVDEWFADRPEEPISLPTGQALVIKF